MPEPAPGRPLGRDGCRRRAGLLGLAFGLQAASALENVFWETAHIANEVLIRGHVFTVLYAAQALGAILVAGAFAESRRTPPTTSIYGA